MEDINKIEQKNFPKRLKEIPDCPSQLYIRGKFPNEELYFLTIVGSRLNSQYGEKAVEKIIKDIAGYPIVIVSGLAIGIDSLAHSLAIKHNMKTISVLGSGLNEDVIYPKTNLYLAKEILKNNGALISELEPNKQGTKYTFPARNRIMAGLSDMVLVIECEIKSGTRITARLATEYNRELGAIPSSIFSQIGSGANELIKQGAHCVSSGEDILDIFNLEKEKKKINYDLTENEEMIIKALKHPLSKDELLEITNLSISELQIAITMLEVKDLIKEIMGKIHKV